MERIPIDRIATQDRRFCISYPLADELLGRSIRNYGILSPCLLIDLPPLVMVTGFKRLEAAQKLGMVDVPAVIINAGRKEALLTAITDNVGRGLNAVEKAQSVERLLSLGFTTEELREMMYLLGLQFHDRTIKLCQALASSEEETRAFVVATGISVDSCEHLFAFTPDERAGIVSLLFPYRPSASNTREILQALRLLKVQGKGIPFEAMAASAGLDELKRALKGRSHPILSSYEERFAEIMRELAPAAAGMDIRVDPFFEREDIQVTIRISGENQATECAERLKQMEHNGFFRRIFELTSGRYRRD